jgi:uracil-DNA glycosylase
MQTPDSWMTALGVDPLAHAPALHAFLATEEAQHAVYPPAEERFAALRLTPFASVKVVLLGQDPYHGAGQANGLSFSVNPPTKPPPSLRNIYKELTADVGCATPTTGDLSPWARQGVLLLNTVLTVRHKTAGSHRKKGWEDYTNQLIDALAARERPVAFVLWGKTAQQKAERIGDRHLIVQSPHPSPYSAHTGFFGSRPFTAVNTWLASVGVEPVDWSLP